MRNGRDLDWVVSVGMRRTGFHTHLEGFDGGLDVVYGSRVSKWFPVILTPW